MKLFTLTNFDALKALILELLFMDVCCGLSSCIYAIVELFGNWARMDFPSVFHCERRL